MAKIALSDYKYLRNIVGFQSSSLKAPIRCLQLLYTVDYKNSESLFMHYSQKKRMCLVNF